ncbi:YpjP family protein [Evansella tamaricis]|uniref:YpjP family protein n=1 Tax=Evansella tamaricis TaxID=2069301 RepID=A0ABS6JIQ3_9BACI|nr:YpjP family protein [Evansella tamaricis]MBU9712340.1 YpjP family protein [Evansella tamaricis]
MKLWFKKLSVVLITFMTLGMFIPPTYLEANADLNEVVTSSKSAVNDSNDINDTDETVFIEHTLEESKETEPDSSDYYISYIAERAKEQTLTKLGPKIVQQVEQDLVTTILPNMEEILKILSQEKGKENLHYLEITEVPSEGYGEKIFHVYDHLTMKDVARFHVRRDNRPKEGYWFNFHYHLEKDGFEEHHQIGDVYWDKNTPPKWMS